MGLGGFKGRAPRTCSLGDNTALLSKILITTLGFRPDPLGGGAQLGVGICTGPSLRGTKSPKIRRKPRLSSALKNQPEPQNNTAKNRLSLAVCEGLGGRLFWPTFVITGKWCQGKLYETVKVSPPIHSSARHTSKGQARC